MVAEAKMTKILLFIVDNCSFLFAPGRYRFVDSETSGSFGGDAYVVLTSGRLQMRFVSDRDQLFLGFRAGDASKNEHWFSSDVIQHLLTGVAPDTSEISPSTAAFIEQHIDEIERRFEEDVLPETVRNLDALEKLRANEMFG